IHAAALLQVEKDGCLRHHGAVKGKVLAELANAHLGHRQALRVHAQAADPRTLVHRACQQGHAQGKQCQGPPAAQEAMLLFYDAIHTTAACLKFMPGDRFNTRASLALEILSCNIIYLHDSHELGGLATAVYRYRNCIVLKQNLPFNGGARAFARIRKNISTMDNSSHPAILIVDDDADILLAAEMVLKEEFGPVQTLGKPGQLPELLATQSFDAILLDMNYAMGVTSGEEGLTWLRHIKQQAPET